MAYNLLQSCGKVGSNNWSYWFKQLSFEGAENPNYEGVFIQKVEEHYVLVERKIPEVTIGGFVNHDRLVGVEHEPEIADKRAYTLVLDKIQENSKRTGNEVRYKLEMSI